MEAVIRALAASSLQKADQSGRPVLDIFLDECTHRYGTRGKTLSGAPPSRPEIPSRYLFNAFCQLYLHHVRNFNSLWLLENMPDDRLAEVGLTRADEGVDVVARDAFGRYSAICVLFKPGQEAVTPVELLKFSGLCSRSGPWHTLVVFTNAEAKRRALERMGIVLIGPASLRKIQDCEWRAMARLL